MISDARAERAYAAQTVVAVAWLAVTVLAGLAATFLPWWSLIPVGILFLGLMALFEAVSRVVEDYAGQSFAEGVDH